MDLDPTAKDDPLVVGHARHVAQGHGLGLDGTDEDAVLVGHDVGGGVKDDAGGRGRKGRARGLGCVA